MAHKGEGEEEEAPGSRSEQSAMASRERSVGAADVTPGRGGRVVLLHSSGERILVIIVLEI